MSTTLVTLTEDELCALLHCLDVVIKDTYSISGRHRVALIAIRDRIDTDGEPE